MNRLPIGEDPAGAESVEEAPRDVLHAAISMAVDVMTAEVIDALGGAGVRPILLKGPVLQAWLYDPGEVRPYVDADLLVSPEQYDEAEQVLEGLGFNKVLREWEKRARRLEHDSMWVRPDTFGTVDLHRTLPAARGVAPEVVWRELSTRTLTVHTGAIPFGVLVLDEPARALLLALHAAYHLAYEEVAAKPLEDLERGVARLSPGTWKTASEIARPLRVKPQLARGLCAVTGGAELARRLALPPPSTGVDDAAGFERLAAAQTFWSRLRLILRALLPEPSYLRWNSRLARRGRLGLAAAYVVHPLALIANAPRGYIIWRRERRRIARRSVRNGDTSARPDQRTL